jgi:hypothetical protein
MLKVYQNALMAVIEHSRFSKSDFTGREIEEDGRRFFEICYRNSPLKFRVLSDAHRYESLNYQFVRMAPGFPWWGPFVSDDISKTCNGLATWLEENLSMYVNELECPRIVYTDLDRSWVFVEWHEVSVRAFAGPTAGAALVGV